MNKSSIEGENGYNRNYSSAADNCVRIGFVSEATTIAGSWEIRVNRTASAGEGDPEKVLLPPRHAGSLRLSRC
ncbi:MAG: hypothetical protein JRC87_04355 [Deltaproteobacteria bacterium]|nr:hypothetical protein [Deltaproteobacteria bacterium]